MADSPRPPQSRQARQGRALQSMAHGTLQGRVATAAPTTVRSRQQRVGDDEDDAAEVKVLLIRTGATVPPDTPYGTIIIEDATGLYTGA